MKKNGMLVALMEEYKRATIDYIAILKSISQEEFSKIRDEKSEDLNCKSIQTVTFHLIQSGYTYANYIQSISINNWLEYDQEVNSTEKGIEEIDKMFKYTEQSFNDNWYKSNKELEDYFFETRWKVTYDLEQLLEHVIVHVLRHRRQIEKFLK